MFGFGFPKLAILIAIIAAVWYVFKAIGRRRDLNEVAIKNGKIKKITITSNNLVDLINKLNHLFAYLGS